MFQDTVQLTESGLQDHLIAVSIATAFIKIAAAIMQAGMKQEHGVEADIKTCESHVVQGIAKTLELVEE